MLRNRDTESRLGKAPSATARTDAAGRIQWPGKVTLLALVSQRSQPHCPRPVTVSFVMIVRSSTFMHLLLPNTLPLIQATHAWGCEREISP